MGVHYADMDIHVHRVNLMATILVLSMELQAQRNDTQLDPCSTNLSNGSNHSYKLQACYLTTAMIYLQGLLSLAVSKH